MKKSKLHRYLEESMPDFNYRMFTSYRLRAKAKMPIFFNNSSVDILNVIIDRLKMVVRIAAPIFLLRYGKSNETCAFYTRERQDKFHADRAEFLKRETGKNIRLRDWRDKIYIHRFSQLLLFFKLYVMNLYVGIKMLGDFSRLSHLEFADYLNYKLDFKLSPLDEVYVFYTTSPSLYLFVNSLPKEVTKFYFYEPGSLFWLSRFDTFNDVNLIFFAQVSKDEMELYHSLGMARYDLNRQAVWKHMRVNEAFPNRESRYDVGVYTSGWWAIENAYRCYDLEKVKSGILSARAPALMEVAILEAVNEHTNSFAIYPHPFEKELMNEHGIYPPFWDKYKKHYVLGDSRQVSCMNEAEVGIIQGSSVFFERWGEDLPTFYCSDKESVSGVLTFSPELTPKKYQDFSFSSKQELKTKLTQYFINASES